VDPREQLAEQLTFLTELGVDGFSKDPGWRSRDEESVPREAQAVGGGEPVGQIAQGFSPAPGGREDLPSIRADLGDCTRCKLSTLGRRQIVFGVGNPHARLMFIGEAPGRDEDIQGIPFVGRAGQLLTKMIEAIGLTRDDVYIANVIKCRPPENRNPEPGEVASCEPFLFRQVESINPVVIVALGTFAAQALLKSQDTISRLRGRVYRYGGSQLVPTFHPAYLLRSPDKKRDAWEDLKRAKTLLDAAQPETGRQA
jgi:DNA polymerase